MHAADSLASYSHFLLRSLLAKMAGVHDSQKIKPRAWLVSHTTLLIAIQGKFPILLIQPMPVRAEDESTVDCSMRIAPPAL